MSVATATLNALIALMPITAKNVNPNSYLVTVNARTPALMVKLPYKELVSTAGQINAKPAQVTSTPASSASRLLIYSKAPASRTALLVTSTATISALNVKLAVELAITLSPASLAEPGTSYKDKTASSIARKGHSMTVATTLAKHVMYLATNAWLPLLMTVSPAPQTITKT